MSASTNNCTKASFAPRARNRYRCNGCKAMLGRTQTRGHARAAFLRAHPPSADRIMVFDIEPYVPQRRYGSFAPAPQRRERTTTVHPRDLWVYCPECLYSWGPDGKTFHICEYCKTNVRIIYV